MSACVIYMYICTCWRTSWPLRAAAMAPFTLATAFFTPLPLYALPPSRSSTASWMPVDAPEGTEARTKMPSVVVRSTSTVGLPRESMISRACTRATAENWRVAVCIVIKYVSTVSQYEMRVTQSTMRTHRCEIIDSVTNLRENLGGANHPLI